MEFDSYVSRNRPALMRFATILTSQTWLADDLVSDVLGKAYERWDRIGAVAEPHAYVRRMVVNEYLSWHRRWKRAAPVDDVHLEQADRGDRIEEFAERDAMMRRLSRLPRRQRAALVLRYYAGLPDDEIARVLDCREATVRSLVFRALNALRIELTPVTAAAGATPGSVTTTTQETR